MILKLGMDHLVTYDDPGLTLTFLRQGQTWVKITNCAYTRTRYQVSDYRIIGPLVIKELRR